MHMYSKIVTELKGEYSSGQRWLLFQWESLNLSGDVFLMVPDFSFSDVSWKRLAKKKARIPLPLNFLDGSISVVRCNVIFSFFSFPHSFICYFKKGAFDLNLQGGEPVNVIIMSIIFNWNIIFQGSCTISETDNFKMRQKTDGDRD